MIPAHLHTLLAAGRRHNGVWCVQPITADSPTADVGRATLEGCGPGLYQLSRVGFRTARFKKPRPQGLVTRGDP